MAIVSNKSRQGFIRKVQFERTKPPKSKKDYVAQILNEKAHLYRAEKCRRDFSYFIRYMWPEVSSDELQWNWHIDYLAEQLTETAEQVGKGQPRKNDLIINIPPGTTKSTIVSIMFPVWCWIKWPWMRFIIASYSGALALEHAEVSRDLVRSQGFTELFPELSIKRDKDTKSNFRLQYTTPEGRVTIGGSRLSTSVGGTLTGFHGHVLIVDDPLDPNRSVSDVELKSTNRWIDQTLSTRKIDKAVTPTILIMQRLHQNDPTGHLLAKKKENIKHISLPGEIRNYKEELKPAILADKYEDDLLDSNRMTWKVLKDMEADLGQYGYSGQVGQKPTPPGGGMFQVDHFNVVRPGSIHHSKIKKTIRYWDKAGTKDGGARTAGVKMSLLDDGRFLVEDVVKGQWATNEREKIIKNTANADGFSTHIWHEQEPGSGGKDSARATTLNLAGFIVHAQRAAGTGSKVERADPYSVQVNDGNVLLIQADWNHDFIEEHRFFPFGTYKDQIDGASGAFNKLKFGNKGFVL